MSNPLETWFPTSGAHAVATPWPNDSADRGYVIFITGRCGSTHLADLLARTGLCGVPDEYFNESIVAGQVSQSGCSDLAGYIAWLVANRSAGRRFGFKIDGLRHRRLCDLADPLAFFPPSAFGFVYMMRRNVLEQAYSYAHAKRVGVWHRTRDAVEPPAEIVAPDAITDRDLWEELALILCYETHFEGYFLDHGLSVTRIDYEMLCASQAFVVGTVMLAAGRSTAEIGSSLASLQGRHVRIEYGAARTQRLLGFQAKYRTQLDFVESQRGRRLSAALRQFFLGITGIDLTRV